MTKEEIICKDKLIKYLKSKIQDIDIVFDGLVPQDIVWDNVQNARKKTYQEILEVIKEIYGE